MKIIEKIFSWIFAVMFSIFLLAFSKADDHKMIYHPPVVNENLNNFYGTFYPLLKPIRKYKGKFYWVSMITKDTTFNGRPAKITYDQNQNYAVDSGLAILWWPGEGEINANNISGLNLYGPHYYINTLGTWDGSVVYDGKTFHPVIISFLPPAGGTYFDPTTQKPAVDAMRTRFNLKKRGLGEIDISQGSQYADGQAGYQPTAGDHSYNDNIAAIVCIEGNPYAKVTSYGGSRKYPYMYVDWVVRGGKYLAFEQDGDGGRDEAPRCSKMDSAVANSATRYICHYGTGAHGSFPTFTDPTAVWNTSKSGVISRSHGTVDINTNVYTWLISKMDTSSAVTSSNPIANAGADQSITLPVSSVTVDASGSFGLGGATISSYAWSKISGPSGGTITSASSVSTTITALVAGVYIFRVTVTDNNGLTGTDDIKITVISATNLPPTVNVGADQTLTMPTTSTSATVSASDADGTIASYSWFVASGGSLSFGSPTSVTTTISGFSVGTYQIACLVTDNGGATASDTLQVTVRPASTGNEIDANVAIKLSQAPFSPIWQQFSPDSSSSFAIHDTSGNDNGWRVQIAGINHPARTNATNYGNGLVTISGLPYQALKDYTSGPTNGTITLTFTGFDTSQLYTFKLGASVGVASPIRHEMVRIGSDSAEIFVNNNYSKEATFINKSPDATGKIVITLSPTNSTYVTAYLNYFRIIKQGSAVNSAPILNGLPNVVLTLPVDSFYAKAVAMDPNGDSLFYSWNILPPNGEASTFDHPDSANTWIRGLDSAGLHTVQVTVRDIHNATVVGTFTINVVNPFGKPSILTSTHYLQYALSQTGKYGVLGLRDTTFIPIYASISANTINVKWNVIGTTFPVRFLDSLNDTTSIWTKQAGECLLRVTAYSLTDSASDTLQIRLTDYENVSVRGCRVGPPHVYVMNGSSALDMVYEQLAKTIFQQYGEYPLGLDTVKLKKNTVNGGKWKTFRLGGISGCDTGYIHFEILDSAVQIITPQFACCSDTSVMRFFDFVHKPSVDGYYYGFVVDNPTFNLTAGVSTYLASDFHIQSWYIRNAATAFFIKVDQNVAKLPTLNNYFRYYNVHLSHSMVDTTGNGEGTYIGPTDQNGYGNGHTFGISSVRLENIEVDHLEVNGTYRDGIQAVGLFIKEHDNWVYDIGLHNEGQQRFNTDDGGFGAQVYNNVTYLGREGIGAFSHGTVGIFNNWEARNRTLGVLGNSAFVQVIPEKCCGMTGSVFIEDHNQWRGWYDVHDNIFELSEVVGADVKITDPNSAISPDTPSLVRNNLFVDSTGQSLSTHISNIVGTQYNTNNSLFVQNPIQIFNQSSKFIGPKFFCYDPVSGQSATFTDAATAIAWRRGLLIPQSLLGKPFKRGKFKNF